MALQFFNETSQLKTERLTAVIFGEPGIGKTSLANTSKNPLMLDFDRGIQRSIVRHNYIRIDAWEDIVELQKSPELLKIAPDTIIIDTVGTMLDNYIAEYVKRIDPKNARRGGELALQGYGAMKTVFKQFKDWANSMNCNLVFVAHAKSEDEGDNKQYTPKLTGGSYDILRQETDLIGYMYSYQNKRVIDFAPKDSHVGKDCAGIGMVTIPDAKEPEYSDYFGQLIDRTIEQMNSINENQQKVIAEISEIRAIIGKITTSIDANIVIDDLKSRSKTVQLQCFAELKKQCEPFAKYNSTSKQFEENV
jgi:hypothetical protein